MKVAICMITYNQENFISEAIESVLKQKTDFLFQLMISDDGSNDGTSEICKSYASRFPETIKYIYHEKNIGMMPNFIETLNECRRAEYTAICEGDDFWTDENKLQKQFDFLEANNDFALCCHNHSVLTDKKLILGHKDAKNNSVIVTTEDYLLDPFFHTSSYFFRNSAQPEHYPEWYKKVLAGDHFLVLFLSLKGKIAYLNKQMSVFRLHSSGVSTTRKNLEIKNNFIRHLVAFNEYSNFRFDKTIHRVIDRWNLVHKPIESKSYFEKINYLIKHAGFYLDNFKRVGGLKLLLKYLLPVSFFNKRYIF